MAEDFSKVTASVAQLGADITALIATNQANNQTKIDALQAQVDALDAQVKGATTTP